MRKTTVLGLPLTTRGTLGSLHYAGKGVQSRSVMPVSDVSIALVVFIFVSRPLLYIDPPYPAFDAL